MMKSVLIYGGLFVGSFCIMFQVALLAVLLKPEWFDARSDVVRAQPATIPAESETVPAPDQPDTAASPQPEAGDKKNVDSTEMKPSLAIREAAVAESPESDIGVDLKLPPADDGPGTGIDSVRIEQLRMKAKLLEAMDPASAAKILTNLEDDEVKIMLMALKKKQAGRILAELEPKHAARIIR